MSPYRTEIVMINTQRLNKDEQPRKLKSQKQLIYKYFDFCESNGVKKPDCKVKMI